MHWKSDESSCTHLRGEVGSTITDSTTSDDNPRNLSYYIYICTYREKVKRIKEFNGKTRLHQDLISHALECDSCMDWLTGQVEPLDVEFESRLADYCCLRMFQDREGASDKWRPYWPNFDSATANHLKRAVVGAEGNVKWELPGGIAIAACPWCGTRLPRDIYSDFGVNRPWID